MTAEHTKEPWKWDGPDLWHFGNGYMPQEKTDPHLYTGVRLDENLANSPIQQANGARIVACVNACIGINPEAVPDLFAVCLDIKSHCNECGIPIPCGTQLAAAIAKAKPQAAAEVKP